MIAHALPVPRCFDPVVFTAPAARHGLTTLPRHLKSGSFDFTRRFLGHTRYLGPHSTRWQAYWGRVAMAGYDINLCYGGGSDVVKIGLLGGVETNYTAPKKKAGRIVFGAFIYMFEGVPSICGAIAKNIRSGQRRRHKLWMVYAGRAPALFRFENGEDVLSCDKIPQQTMLIHDATWLATALWVSGRFPLDPSITPQLMQFFGQVRPSWNKANSVAQYVLTDQLDEIDFEPWKPWIPAPDEII